MIKLCIFDLDGTLLDTLADLAAAGNFALTSCGFPIHPVEAYKTFVGNGRDRLIQRILPADRVNDDSCHKVRVLFDQYYTEHSLDQTRPYAGVLELLRMLQKSGIALAVWTNKADEYTKKILKTFFPDVIFSAIRGQVDGLPTKPNADAGLQIMRDCNVTSAETVMIGDSNVDMFAADALGCAGVGVTWGFRTADELLEAGAAHLISNPAELLSLL